MQDAALSRMSATDLRSPRSRRDGREVTELVGRCQGIDGPSALGVGCINIHVSVVSRMYPLCPGSLGEACRLRAPIRCALWRGTRRFRAWPHIDGRVAASTNAHQAGLAA